LTYGAIGGDAGGALRRPAEYFVQLTSILSSVGTFWIFCLTFLICADIVARGGFDRPIGGVAEMVGYSIVAAVFLQIANTVHAGGFTRAEVMIGALERKRPVAAAVFNTLFTLLGALVFALIAVGAYAKLVEAWPDLRFGNEESFSVLVWPLRAIVMLGASLAALHFLLACGRSALNVANAVAARRPVGWGALALLAVVVGLVLVAANSDLSRVQVGLLSLAGLLILICLGIHIAVGLITLGFLGIWIMMGDTSIAQNVVKLADPRLVVGGLLFLLLLSGVEAVFLGLAVAPRRIVATLTRGTPGHTGFPRRFCGGPLGR